MGRPVRGGRRARPASAAGTRPPPGTLPPDLRTPAPLPRPERPRPHPRCASTGRPGSPSPRTPVSTIAIPSAARWASPLRSAPAWPTSIWFSGPGSAGAGHVPTACSATMPSRCGTPGGAGSSVPGTPSACGPSTMPWRGERFVFASAVEVVLAVSGVSDALDEAVVAAYLTSPLLSTTTRTFFAAVRKLPPGHTLTAEANGASGRVRTTIERYWRPERAPRARCASDDVYAEEFLALYARAVEDRLRGSDPVGVHVSGGPGFVQRGGARRPCSAAPGSSAPARLQLAAAAWRQAAGASPCAGIRPGRRGVRTGRVAGVPPVAGAGRPGRRPRARRGVSGRSRPSERGGGAAVRGGARGAGAAVGVGRRRGGLVQWAAATTRSCC